jgi:hypothetical protein
VYLHQQGLDARTPAGRPLFGIRSVCADFERAMIVEQIKRGMVSRACTGKGLAPGVKDAVRASLGDGIGIRGLPWSTGVGWTVQRFKRALQVGA